MADGVQDLSNRPFMNTQPPEEHCGVLSVVLDEPYFAHVQHATFGNESRGSRRSKRPHEHSVYHIVLATGGRGSFVLEGEVHPVEAGHLYLTSPGQWHSFGNGEGENTEYSEVTFEFRSRRGRVLRVPFHEMVAAWAGKQTRPVTRTVAGSALHFIIMSEIERMARMGFAQAADFNLYLNESLGRLFLALYTHLYRSSAARAPVDPIRKVHDYIHKHYHERLSLGRMAALAGLSPNYLSRRFKARNNATPIHYQHGLRIRAAANLLTTTEYPIKQIADIVGFSDVYFFSRTFKKVQGVPPGQWRKQTAGAAPPTKDPNLQRSTILL